MTSQALNRPLDVLGLFDAYIAHGIPQERPELQRARAAVAELIEKARAMRSAHEAFQAWKRAASKDESVPRSILEMNVHAKAMLFEALIRFGGDV